MLPLLMSIYERIIRVMANRVKLRKGEEVLHTYMQKDNTRNTQGPRSSETVQSKYIRLDVCQILSSVQYQQ